MYPSIPLRAKLKTSAHQTGHFHALIMNSFPSEAQLGSRGTIIMSYLKNEIKRGKKGERKRREQKTRWSLSDGGTRIPHRKWHVTTLRYLVGKVGTKEYRRPKDLFGLAIEENGSGAYQCNCIPVASCNFRSRLWLLFQNATKVATLRVEIVMDSVVVRWVKWIENCTF